MANTSIMIFDIFLTEFYFIVYLKKQFPSVIFIDCV